MSGSGTSWTSALTLSGDETEGATAFSCASFTDATGNVGVTDTTATSGAVTIDRTAPTMAITSGTVSSGATSNDATIALVFTSSESVSDFASGDVALTGGTMSNFAGSGTTYTATFAPSADGATTIAVAGGEFNDATGNDNTVSNTFAWTYDGTAPTLEIAMASDNTDNTKAKSGDTITLTITASESITGLVWTIDGETTTMGGS